MNEQPQSDLPDKDAGLAIYVNDLFQEFKEARKPYETKADEWWYNFLAQYQENKTWRNKEGQDNRSRIFIKVTQQKCYTAHAKVMDALGQDIPFGFEPLKDIDYSPIPEKALKQITEFRRHYINDYLKHIKFIDTLDDVILSSTVFPCAILKGPILVTEKQPVVKRRMISGMPAEQLDPRLSPFIVTEEHVDKYIFEEIPFWDYYVDVNVRSNKRSIGEIHYKLLSKQEFRELMDDPGYDRLQMGKCLQNLDTLANSLTSNEDDKTDRLLGDKYTSKKPIKDNKIPIIEFYGLVPVEKLRQFGSDVPENIKDDEDVEACVTVAAENIVIKAKFNFYGYRPFMLLGCKKIPNSIYKNSIAGLMDDSQSMINSGARMLIDNKALSGNGCVAVNKDKIDWLKTKDMSIYPRKAFYVKGNADVREAIGSISFPDVTFGLREMIEFFFRMADEETGIPKYTQGEGQATSYLNKTASGISMIMGAANVNLKPFLKNIDDNIIEPVIERLDALFSMLGKYSPEVNIPLKIHATGTISLIAKELIVENLLKLLQITQNPQDNLIVRRREMITEIARKLDLAEFVKSDQEIQQIEQMLAERQQPFEMKGEVDIDRLYPLLSRFEQMQILARIGVQPDPSYQPPPIAAPVAQGTPEIMPGAMSPPQMPPEGTYGI